MKIRSILAAVAAVGLLAMAGSANAIITITSQNAAPGDAALGHGVANGAQLTNGQVMIDNFGDNGGAQTPLAGFTFSPQVFDQDGGVAGYIRSGAGPPQLLSGESAPPPIWNANPNAIVYETGNYYTVTSDCVGGGIGCAHSATLAVDKGWLSVFSFYLGSPDQYNSVKFFDDNGQVGSTLTGNAIWACPSCGQSGFQGFGARAIYNFGGAHITSIQFSTTGSVAPSNSFEFDNLAGVIHGVPEPATWLMLIMGFGGIGGVLRRRRQATAFA